MRLGLLLLLASCTPDDTGGDDTSDTGPGNAIPTTPVFALGPDGATTEDDLLAVLVTPSTDADDDPLTYRFSWTKDDVAVPGLDSTAVPAAMTARGETWEITIVVNDGTDDSVPATEAITIANATPHVERSIDPAVLYTDTVATAVWSVEDPDGDEVLSSLEWRVDGVVAGTGSTLDGAAFERDDLVRLVVLYDDGHGAVGGAPVETIVANSPPTAPTVAISPSDPLLGDDLLCVPGGSTDADGDEVTYEARWEVDGSTWFGDTTDTNWPGDTIAEADTAPDDVWTCIARADDGLDQGAGGTASATVIWEGAREFGPCGATGATGPTTCPYTGTVLEGEVAVDDGLQTWVVPATARYRIEAWGAQGGGANGGLGAYAAGTWSLAKGTELVVAVGQAGSASASCGGGGGGSFVADIQPVALLVAGGGGGEGTVAGCDGLGGEYASATDCDPKTDGWGEGGLAAGGQGGGGAGWGSAGQGPAGGAPWSDLTGGTTSACGAGGFGGGGGGQAGAAGGGGGGWSGGDGGATNGGGGGSTATGDDVDADDGARSGAGAVVIDVVEP